MSKVTFVLFLVAMITIAAARPRGELTAGSDPNGSEVNVVDEGQQVNVVNEGEQVNIVDDNGPDYRGNK